MEDGGRDLIGRGISDLEALLRPPGPRASLTAARSAPEPEDPLWRDLRHELDALGEDLTGAWERLREPSSDQKQLQTRLSSLYANASLRVVNISYPRIPASPLRHLEVAMFSRDDLCEFQLLISARQQPGLTALFDRSPTELYRRLLLTSDPTLAHRAHRELLDVIFAGSGDSPPEIYVPTLQQLQDLAARFTSASPAAAA